jgi:hypothetical protein
MIDLSAKKAIKTFFFEILFFIKNKTSSGNVSLPLSMKALEHAVGGNGP